MSPEEKIKTYKKAIEDNKKIKAGYIRTQEVTGRETLDFLIGESDVAIAKLEAAIKKEEANLMAEPIKLETKDQREEFIKYALSNWTAGDNDLMGDVVSIDGKEYKFPSADMAHNTCVAIDHIVHLLESGN